MANIKIGGRTFALAFTMDALDQIEQHISDFNMAAVTDFVKRPGAMVDILYAMAQQGELLQGRELEMSRTWFGAHIPAVPKKIAELQIAIYDTITEAVKMENETEQPAVRDVVLDEIKKKETKDASPGGPSSTMD